ncbi:MAG TPA: Kdo hydroxylase family protein [Casimicrobiaceae bacterium]|nr:Kdo hydroxylase family protein [Casimicrobiaceae bacterium]
MAQYLVLFRELIVPDAAGSPKFDPVVEVALDRWDGTLAPEAVRAAVSAVEAGAVLLFPRLAFTLAADETRFLSERWHDGRSKNMSFDVNTSRVGGTNATGADRAALSAMMARFAAGARSLCTALFSSYRPQPHVMRTSFRAAAADQRETSWRKDDRLLHIDAFPSRPNHGARILRVFSNVNPHGDARVWRIGEPFADVAQRFFARLPPFHPLAARALAALHVTKELRSPYDHYMLHLHDAMKADAEYQRNAPQTEMPFPPGSTWVCFSDQVSHAVMRGQYMFEQTLDVPVSAMQHPERSPLRVLERIAGARLA